ncbi:MAG: hypothetical protein A3F16_01250 [Deltaproteobacteria bacterium RIFCSPHIGHO2_12_FULL_43_9]|nr:MAG: hypothetical protein A3F16_01250 [Deltaproteobacteria bacterium RIFCSPHIGHO2_12_FULL_43_9]
MVKVFEEPVVAMPVVSIPMEKPKRRASINYNDLWFIPHGEDGIIAKQTEETSIHGINGIKNIHVAEYVYQIIDGKLHYPGEFIEREVEGVVSVDLPIDEGGSFLLTDLNIRSSSHYLKVYIHRLLRSSLIYKIPSNMINYKGKYILKAHFIFESTTLEDDELVERESYFSGNSLFFYRNYVKDTFSWNLGPISGQYYWHPDLAPDLIEIDLIAAANYLYSLFTGKRDADAMEKYRNDPAW